MEIFDWKIFSAWGEHFQQSHSFLSRFSLLLEKNARTLVDNLIFSWFQLHFRYSAVSDINKLIFILRKFLADVFPSFPLLTYSSHSAAVSVFFWGCQYILRLSKCANVREKAHAEFFFWLNFISSFSAVSHLIQFLIPSSTLHFLHFLLICFVGKADRHEMNFIFFFGLQLLSNFL